MKDPKQKLRERISQGIGASFTVWKDEIKRIFGDSAVLIFFFLVPLAYPILYAFIYDEEVVRESKLVVVDDSRSSLSREFVRRVDASPDVKVLGYCADMEEAENLLDRKQAYGIMHIPGSFSTDLNTGKQTKVLLFSDMSCMLYYKSFLMTATEVSLDMGKEIRFRAEPAQSRALREIEADPVSVNSVSLFNSQSGFASFLVPAILILVLQQTLVLGICLLGGTEYENLRSGKFRILGKAYDGTFRVMFGKALAYVIVYIPVCVWTLIVVPYMFHLPMLSTLGKLSLFLLPYLLACVFFSMTLAGFMRHRESPMMLFVFFSVVLVFISGVSWPWDAVPDFWKMVAYLFPSTPGIQGFVALNTMGADLNDIAFQYKALWIQTGVYFVTASLMFRKELGMHRRNHYLAD